MGNVEQKIMHGIEKFRSYYGKAVKAIRMMARQFAKDEETYPLAFSMYKKEFPQVSNETWHLFREIGHGRLTPAAFNCGKVYNVSMVEKAQLPMKVQLDLFGDDDCSGKKFTVVCGNRQVQKIFTEMNKEQVRTLIDIENGRIRTVEQQEEYLATSGEHTLSNSPYEVLTSKEGKKFKVNKKVILTVDEIIKICQLMGLKVSSTK